jgi:LAO/AO transport system kinase
MSAANNINFKSVARSLTVVENDLPGADELLKSIHYNNSTPIIGITGPPGAGKSTLVNSGVGYRPYLAI